MVHRMRFLFVRALRWFVNAMGGIVLSEKAYSDLVNQRNCAVLKLAKIFGAELKLGLTGIVVSKDRALQLYALLRSYEEFAENYAPLYIIYTASNDTHKKSYQDIKTLAAKINIPIYFIEEKNGFRATLLNVVMEINDRNIFFLVDDNIFIRKFDLSFAANLNTEEYILSFRHSPHIRRSYTANQNQDPPKLAPYLDEGGLFEFSWFEKGNEWSDPWSLDGQVLPTSEVKAIAIASSYIAPNTFESSLKSFNDFCRDRKGLCYFESKLINLPINRVQNECNNRSGNISVEYLLNQWNFGMMMDTSMLSKHTPISTHEEHPIAFKKRLL